MVRVRRLFSPAGWRHFLREYGLLTLLTLASLTALALLSLSVQQAGTFADTYVMLLLGAITGLFLLTVLLIRMLLRLRRHVRAQRAGSRIALRLSLLITSLVGVPVLIIYLFALQFLYQGIDTWFDIKTETALKNATKLVRLTLDDQARLLLNLTRSSAHLFQQELQTTPALTLDKLRQLLNAEELVLLHGDRQQLSFSTTLQNAIILPKPPPSTIVQQVRQGNPYAAVETREDDSVRHTFFRVVIPLQNGQKIDILQAIFPLPQHIVSLSQTVESAYTQYQQRAFLREPLKTTLTLILTLVFLLSLISALLFTLQLVHHFTRPIRYLTHATRDVAAGQLEPIGIDAPDDEMGELVRSFNEMVEQIKKARHTARINHQQVELQKAYLQTIINNLTNGVITLDGWLHIRLYNQQAEKILGVSLKAADNQTFPQLATLPDYAPLQPLWQAVEPMLKQADGPWELQFNHTTAEGERILLIQGAPLPAGPSGQPGHVLVFEDITTLVQAQRSAAWHDVARRLAHEIKNPLTPIQLSAERLSFKLAPLLPEKEQALLRRLTATIVEQVQTMQTLVNAFSDYARSPRLNKTPTNLHDLIENVAHLYERPGLTIDLHLDADCSIIHVDPDRLRQLLNNLIKNAIEALQDTPDPRIELRTRCEGQTLFFSICDNGPGLSQEDLSWIFEPYATNKPKGTGLGLAIVKKIVEEHNGTIHAESAGDGTCFHIQFPMTTAHDTSSQ